MASIDTKMQKLQKKLIAMQAELNALENQKKAAQITKETEWVNNLIQDINEILIKNNQKSPAALMKILVETFGNGKSLRNTNDNKINKKPLPVKYRDTAPGCEHNTWSGRGLAPLWIKRYEAVGRKKEEFLINAS
ncbi:MAG: H-NS histone family protein [Thiotrichales bacterium]|jgi:DNA-binding protein H-NS|nr:H-NS histone family protein [Thiotrichales bacterium]